MIASSVKELAASQLLSRLTHPIRTSPGGSSSVVRHPFWNHDPRLSIASVQPSSPDVAPSTKTDPLFVANSSPAVWNVVQYSNGDVHLNNANA